MKRWIPTIDIVVFGGIPLVITILVLASVFFEQPWPPVKIVFAIGVPLASWVVFGLVLWSKWRAKPTLITSMGTAVWEKGIPVTETEIVKACQLYSTVVGKAHVRLDPPVILAMLSLARFEFVPQKIWGRYAGLQRGRAIKVQWGDGFGHNAFFHELHHMVDEVLLMRPVDYKHERLAWWDLVGAVKRAWRRKHGSAV